MNAARRKALLADLTSINEFVARNYDPETAEVARHAIGLAADFIHAGKPAVTHLQSMRLYVQQGLRW